MSALELRSLSKAFRDTLAVDRLDLQLQEGELYALLGVNGAGKTTTLKLISGLLRPTTGQVLLFDQPLQRPGRGGQIAVCPQQTAIAQQLTVRENLYLMAGVYGLPRRQARQEVRQLLEQLQLQPYARKRAGTLSGGWQRRLSIAMALVARPRLLLLDEPTLGLDVLARRELWKLIRALRGQMSILLTTHYMEEAAYLADRVGILAAGRLVAQGSPQELVRQTGALSFEDAFVRLAGGEQ